MSTATYVAISLPILIGISALAIDIGLINNESTRLQLAVDASAIAAAEYISGEDCFEPVQSEAIQIASLHRDYDSTISSEQVEVVLGDFMPDGSFIQNDAGEYVKVTITNNIPTIFGSIFGNQGYTISSNSIAGKVSTTVTDCVPVMESDWPCLLFAADSLELTGNFNLSVDQDLDNAAACTNAPGLTLGGNLNISNEIDLHMGPGCPYSNGVGCVDSHGNSYTFTGSTTPMGQEYELPTVEYPDDYESLPNGVRVGGRNGGIVTNLSPGQTYFVDGDLTTTNNQSINILNSSSGCQLPNGELNPTTIYVNGNVSLSGGVTGNVGHPECLDIRVIGERTVRINGRTTFHGNIYAPESEVYPNGNASFYGTIVAGSIRANGNNNIILSSSYGDRVPNASDDVTCEESEIQVLKVRVVQ
jgi:hypothetical protein